MKENSKEIVLEFNLPKFSRKDIKIKITKNTITIKAERKDKVQIKKKGFFQGETINKTFDYSTNLPSVNHKNAKVTFTKGLLIIKIPKLK